MDVRTIAFSSRRASAVTLTAEADAIAAIERLPKWLLCIPLVAQWCWLALKFRSLTLPSALNPHVETGGLVGESKLAYFRRIDDRFAGHVAKTAAVYPGEDADLVRGMTGITYPLVAKPDIGWCGYGVRRINTVSELAAYAEAFPPPGPFLVQQLATGVREAGILYVRKPGEVSGRIGAMTIRHLPQVTGDGVRTVGALIAASPRTALKLHVYQEILSAVELSRVPVLHERVLLTTVASARVGGRYEDATALVTPALEKIVDELSRSMGEFHYGRYDVKFESLRDLRDGRFTVIEVNGAGSEAIHFWDARLTLAQAFQGVFAKQREIFALGHLMRARGVRPVGVARLLTAFLWQRRLIKHYPPSN